MDKDQIDSLIWGDFESKIVEMEVPLFTMSETMRTMAMDGAFALFNGFLTFLMYKLGYKPKLPEKFNVDLEDYSWWIENLDNFSFMGLGYIVDDDRYSVPPFIVKQFFNETGKDITIFLLLNWFSFYEVNLALSKSKLDNDSKFTQLRNEFQMRGFSNHQFIEYMKDLQDEDFGKSHTLVLRPDKLSDFITSLDEDYSEYFDFPDDVYTKEQWNKMSSLEKMGTYGKKELIFCKEDNFRELLDKVSIKIPNTQFVTFSEFIQDKLASTIQEWTDIRDRYILRLRNSIKEPHLSNDFSRAKKFLQYSKKSLDDNNFNESVVSSAKAIEDALSTFLKRTDLRLEDKIKEIESNQELGNHVPNLHYIRSIRNRTVHANDFEVTEEIATHVFEMANQFIADIQKTI